LEHQRKDVDHLGLSEPWLSILTRKLLRRGSFASVDDLTALQRATHQFIAEWNEIAHPFRWTSRSFEKILAKVDAALAADNTTLAPAA
jgi:hypothetical protein